MRLTLSEALKDDIVALEAGVHQLVPLKDSSGRQLLFVSPHNHTGEGYTSDSLVSELCCLNTFITHSINESYFRNYLASSPMVHH